jgi:peptide chain release factor 1
VTVAVLEQAASTAVEFNPKDFKIEWYSGTGNGGQNKNKVQACCRLVHLSTGLTQTAQTRSRENSYKLAYTRMIEALAEQRERQQHELASADRKDQVGSGMRGDKIRTYRFQDDIVADHVTGKKASLSKVMKGNFDLVW